MDEKIARCPFCAERIQPQATVCRFCGRDLPNGAVVTSAAATPPASTFTREPMPMGAPWSSPPSQAGISLPGSRRFWHLALAAYLVFHALVWMNVIDYFGNMEYVLGGVACFTALLAVLDK